MQILSSRYLKNQNFIESFSYDSKSHRIRFCGRVNYQIVALRIKVILNRCPMNQNCIETLRSGSVRLNHLVMNQSHIESLTHESKLYQ